MFSPNMSYRNQSALPLAYLTFRSQSHPFGRCLFSYNDCIQLQIPLFSHVPGQRHNHPAWLLFYAEQESHGYQKPELLFFPSAFSFLSSAHSASYFANQQD